MAEYNPSKIIKDGNTYNFRDTTKIPLAGSNQISGDLIPSTDGTVNLGNVSYQWNNAYIKSLTINGVACGDILTHNVSEFVNVTTAQTIGGQKTFTTSPRVTRTFPDIALNISDCDVTEVPTEAKFASLYFRDKNNKNLAYIAGQQRINGTKRMCIRTHRTNDINNYYSVDLDSDGDFYPEQNNTLRLGTPALQWNTTYTRNILIDNDINIASSLINKTSTSGVLTMRGGISDTEGASLSLYGKDYGGSPGLIGNIYMTAYGNSDYTNFRIYPNGIIRVYNNSTATTKNVAMQEDTVNLTTAQTIAGNKTFSGTIEFTSSPMVKRTSDPFYHLTTTGYNKGTNPSSNLYSGIRFFSNPNDTAQNKITGGLDMVYYASGYNAIGLNVRNYDENSNHRFFTVALRVSNDSTIPVDFVPSVNALINLGSSTTYWKGCYTKAINGVNPGALSLPSTATGYVDIKSTVGQYLKDNNTNIYEFTAPFDGWVCVGIIKGSLRIDNVTTSISSGSEVLGYWCSYTIPFRKDDVIQIKINKMDPADDYVNDIMWKAYIYPCQGNV